jgi:hypothetical protein
MSMLRLHTGSPRATARLAAFATTATLALAPLAALADGYDYAGRPFPLWVFLVPGAGILALVAALIAKGAVERGR